MILIFFVTKVFQNGTMSCMSLCFSLTQWSASFYGSLSAYSRPLPSEKNSPLTVQLKIAFRRFLFISNFMESSTVYASSGKLMHVCKI